MGKQVSVDFSCTYYAVGCVEMRINALYKKLYIQNIKFYIYIYK